MIKDCIKNAKNYYNISKELKKGFQWIIENNLEKLADGRYEIDGDKLYASIQTYETKDNAKYESHREYIDIQYMIKGVEKIGVTCLENCSTCIQYDSAKDLEFYDINCSEEFFKLATGEFMVFFPQDAHKPSISMGQKTTVKKVVVKVKAEN